MFLGAIETPAVWSGLTKLHFYVHGHASSDLGSTLAGL